MLASNQGPSTGKTENQQLNIWTSAKELSLLVEAAVMHKQPGIRPDLEAELNANKQNFVQLLKNPPRTETDASLIRKATTEGIRIPGMDASRKLGRLPSQVVDEAVIIAEMFNLNEIVALQLLVSGEERLCDYPWLTRGLVAVLLYYDGRKTMVYTLRTMILGNPSNIYISLASSNMKVRVMVLLPEKYYEKYTLCKY